MLEILAASLELARITAIFISIQISFLALPAEAQIAPNTPLLASNLTQDARSEAGGMLIPKMISSSTQPILTQMAFLDLPPLAIARCESENRQFKANGELIIGDDGCSVGRWQINRCAHDKELALLKLDPTLESHNDLFASILYKREGLTPWRNCRLKEGL